VKLTAFTVAQFFGWDFGINQSSIKILMSEHCFISAKDEPAERWCVANECRKACGCKAGIFVFLTNQV
jgi:hypothetical protein